MLTNVPYFRWINSRRVSGWGSTLDTLLAVDALLMWDVRFNENDADDPKDMALEVDIGNRLEFVFEKKTVSGTGCVRKP